MIPVTKTGPENEKFITPLTGLRFFYSAVNVFSGFYRRCDSSLLWVSNTEEIQYREDNTVTLMTSRSSESMLLCLFLLSNF